LRLICRAGEGNDVQSIRKALAMAAITGALVAAAVASSTPVVNAQTAYDASFDPGPSNDTFLDQKFTPASSTANGTVLDSRQITVKGPLATSNPPTAWQVWFKTTSADGEPIAAVTTILKPTPWNGKLVSNNYAIDGLGLQCNLSYQLTHSYNVESPNVTQQLLDKRYAVLLTDYQGPHMAYSNGPTEGPEVLDGIRAALNYTPAALQNAQNNTEVAMVGYSGGAIATAWAAQLQPTYAPELNMVGAASGGTPADPSLLPARMDGKPPVAVLYLLAALGNARVTPGALALANPIGVQLGHQFKDACFPTAALLGLGPVPLASLTNPFIYSNPIVKSIMANGKAGGKTPTMPVYLWHGDLDEFIPLAGAQALQKTWQQNGANVTLTVVPGDHVTAAYYSGPMTQIDQWMGQ
jgi:predicted esterase